MIFSSRKTGEKKRPDCGARSDAGFTLTELMIVVVIVSVLLILAAPGYSTLILRTKLKSYTNEIVAGIYYARSEAVKRNTPIKLCITNALKTDCKGSGSWEEGWVILDPNDLILRRHEGDAFADGMKIVEASSKHTITFNPSGLMTPDLTLKVCQQSPNAGIEERSLSVTTTGRPTVNTTRTGCP